MTIPQGLRFDVLARDNFTCQFCGRVVPETQLEVDHLHPRSLGGSDDLANLIATCVDCNRGKRDKIVARPGNEWASLVGTFFHLLGDDGKVDWQGQIEARLDDGKRLVVLYFDWFTGAPMTRRVIDYEAAVAAGLFIYRSAEAMRESYEHAFVPVRRSPSPEREPAFG